MTFEEKEMIESLETRRLFSTVATDEAALTADALAVKADFTTVVAAAKTEATAVTGDLKALPKTKANKGLIKSALKDEGTVAKALTNGIKKLVAVESGKLKQLVGDGIAVALHPSNVADQKRLKALLASVTAAVETPLTTLAITAYPAISTVAGAFSAIEIVNPADTQLPADLNTDGGAVSTDLSKLGTDAQTFQTDLTTLVAAL
jgi:hypothetical protein